MLSPRVSFVVAGTQKGGTTALHRMLQQHPEVHLPDQKELHFFDYIPDSPVNALRFVRYNLRFKPAAGQICGDFTPSYMYWDGAFERIRDYNPSMRIVMILRNPVERAHSHWTMDRKRGRETLDFEEAIRCELDRSETGTGEQDRVRSYCARGYYAAQVRRAKETFGPEKVHLIRYDDYAAEQEAELARLCSFLGIRDDVALPQTWTFRSGRGDLDDGLRSFLLDHFRSHNDELERETGWDLGSWNR
jgi:hypothetical protein